MYVACKLSKIKVEIIYRNADKKRMEYLFCNEKVSKLNLDKIIRETRRKKKLATYLLTKK